MRTKKTSRKKRRGAVTVEMAITLPLLFLIVMTSIEFGRLNVIRHTVDNAAYEAARRAIVPGVSAETAEDEARRIMSIVGARGVDVQISPSVLQVDTPEVNVNVSVSFDENGFLAPFFFAGRRVVGSVTMTRETL